MARIGKVDNSSLSDPVFSPLKPDGENRITISGLLPTGETFTVEHGQVQIESASSFGTGFSTRTFTPADPTATEQVIEALNLRFSDRDKEAQVGIDKDGFLAIVPHPDLRPSTVPGVTRAPALPEEAPGVLSSVVAAIGNRAKEAIKGKRLPPESKLKWNDQGEVNIHHDVLPLPDTRMFGVEDGVIFIESNPDAAPVDPTDPTATMEGRAFHQADPDDQEKVLTYLKGKYEKQFGPMALTYRGRIVVIEETPDVKADMEAVRDASMDELRASAREKMSWSERRKVGKEETRKQAEEHAARLKYVVEFVNTHDLTALVIQERNRGESDEVIANVIYAQFPDEPEINNVIDWSFTEADKRGKTIKSKKRWAKVPGAKEFAWDRTADEKELFSRVRKMIDNGEDRAQVENDLAATLGTKPGERELIDYIIDRAQDEQFQKEHARQFVFIHGLDQRVLELRKADPAIKPDEILADPQIQAALKPGEKCKAEIKEIIEAAMERADSGKKAHDKGVDVRRHIPFTGEKAWDNFLADKGIYFRIRAAKELGDDEPTIRTFLESLPEIQSHKNKDAIIDYALRHVNDPGMLTKNALRFVQEKKLGEKVYKLQHPELGPAISDEMIESIILDEVPLTATDKEKEEIVKMALKEAKWHGRKETLKAPFKKAWNAVPNRDSVIEAAKTARTTIGGFFSRRWNNIKGAAKWTKDHLPEGKTVLKAAGIGAAGLGVGAGLLGIAGVYGVTKVAQGVMRVGAEVGHQVGDKAPKLAKAVLPTIGGIIKSPFTLIAAPFVGAYRGLSAGWNYPAKPKVRPLKGWTAPFKGIANVFGWGWHKAKAAPSALATGVLGLALGGLWQGPGDAVVHDILGVKTHMPVPAFMTGGGGHAPAAAHAAETPAPAGHAPAPAAHAPAGHAHAA